MRLGPARARVLDRLGSRPGTGAELRAVDHSASRRLGRRTLSAAVGVPLVAALVWMAPAWLFGAVILGAALVGQWELYAMFRRIGVAARRGAGLSLGALVVLAFAVGGQAHPWAAPLALSVAVAGCLVLGLDGGAGAGFDWAGIGLTLLGVCYCAWLLGHAIWLRALPHGAALTLVVLAVTWVGEIAAYFVGGRWGRRRLAPRVSPAKTVEGAAAQLAASVATALVAAATGALSPGHAVGVGLLLGVVGQLGDLAESFLKRSAGAKDASAILPGHGGLLDRLDSLLFNVPALYYYVEVLSI
jgi:phosphatidate cytidylyltransferase